MTIFLTLKMLLRHEIRYESVGAYTNSHIPTYIKKMHHVIGFPKVKLIVLFNVLFVKPFQYVAYQNYEVYTLELPFSL